MWGFIINFFKKLFNKPSEYDLQRTLINDEIKVSDAYNVWYPDAENIHASENIKMRTRYEFDEGYPNGLIVHWNAGHTLPKHLVGVDDGVYFDAARKYALKTAKNGAENGYCFLTMDIYGKIYQSRPLTKSGYHAGKSFHSDLGYSVSRKCIGIELLNVGKLNKIGDRYFTWFKQEIPKKMVRYCKSEGNIQTGYYAKFTPAQEESLMDFSMWLVFNSPRRFDESKIFNLKYILGHDEVAPNRKCDPGGALSMTMGQFRRSVEFNITQFANE